MTLLLLLKTNALDELSPETKQIFINQINLFKEQAITPLIEADPNKFEEKFIEAERYLYALITYLGRTLIKNNNVESSDITQLFTNPLKDLIEKYKQYTDRIHTTIRNGLEIIIYFFNYLILSTNNLNSNYYIDSFRYYIDISVCISALDVLNQENNSITELIIKKCKKVIENLTMLIDKIQREEEKKVIEEGRREYKEEKLEIYENVDDMLNSLKGN